VAGNQRRPGDRVVGPNDPEVGVKFWIDVASARICEHRPSITQFSASRSRMKAPAVRSNLSTWGGLSKRTSRSGRTADSLFR
jgi:hypothetical protein